MRNTLVKADKVMGHGAENEVLWVSEIQPAEPGLPRHIRQPGEAGQVLKYPLPIQGAWQTNTLEAKQYGIDGMHEIETGHIPTALLDKPTILLYENPNERPRRIEPELALMSPKIQDFDKLVLDFEDLFDTNIQEQLIQLAKDAEKMAIERHIGLDPYGGDIVGDFVAGMKDQAFKIMANAGQNRLPAYVEELFRSQARGVPGSMRNVLLGDVDIIITGPDTEYYPDYIKDGKVLVLKGKKIALTDAGYHDMSPVTHNNDIQGKGLARVWNMAKKPYVQSVTFPMQHLTWGTLMEILIQINPEIANRTDLPFKRELGIRDSVKRDIYKTLSREVVRFMLPKFNEHHRRRTGVDLLATRKAPRTKAA